MKQIKSELMILGINPILILAFLVVVFTINQANSGPYDGTNRDYYAFVYKPNPVPVSGIPYKQINVFRHRITQHAF